MCVCFGVVCLLVGVDRRGRLLFVCWLLFGRCVLCVVAGLLFAV